MPERRRYNRIKAWLPLTYCVPPSQEKKASITVDIAGLGLLFPVSQPLENRQELLVNLNLPNNPNAEVHVKVTRVTKEIHQKDPEHPIYWVGVKLQDPIKFDEREYIKYYASQLKKPAYSLET